MRAALARFSSTYLVAYVAAADATLWLAAFPFLLYCRDLLAQQRVAIPFMLLILVINILLLGLMGSAVVATGELIRRGFTRPVRVPLPIFVRVRSRQSEY